MPARSKKVPLTIFQRFFRTETLGGPVMLAFGLAALIIANSPLAEAYHRSWKKPLTLGIVDHQLSLTQHGWINVLCSSKSQGRPFPSGRSHPAVSALHGKIPPQQEALFSLERASEGVTAPVLRLARALHNFSAFVVMPLFAFANAGVKIDLSMQHIEIGLGVVGGPVLPDDK